MILNKMEDEDDVLVAAYALLLYVDPFLTSQSYDIIISTGGTNISVLLALMLMLMSPVFSIAYTCVCTYAYAYALVKTRLYG